LGEEKIMKEMKKFPQNKEIALQKYKASFQQANCRTWMIKWMTREELRQIRGEIKFPGGTSNR